MFNSFIEILSKPLLFGLNQLEGLGFIVLQTISNVVYRDSLNTREIVWIITLIGAVTWFRVSYVIVQQMSLRASKVPELQKDRHNLLLLAKTFIFSAFFLYASGLIALIVGSILSGRGLLNENTQGAFHPLFALFISLVAIIYSTIATPIFWVGELLAYCFKKYSLRIRAVAVLFYIVLCFSIFFTLAESQMLDDAQEAHHLHALVKNTCMFDSQKNHCPRRVKDFRVIEPEFYDEMKASNQVFYKISEDQNNYVLLVRYRKRRALLFRGSLNTVTNERKEDFKVYEINTIGQDRVEKIPDFAKEFEYLPEWK